MSCLSVAEEIMPGRADYLVADAVLRNQSPKVKFPANREKNREIVQKRPFACDSVFKFKCQNSELQRNSLENGTAN